MMQQLSSARRGLSPEDIREFQRVILSRYRRHGRDLPWRATSDPYRILVSEIMLQQTQVDRVMPKYSRFIELFPDAACLASAALGSVLSAWSGLGYNRRAKSLKACAEAIVAGHGGRIPRTREALEQLPGIGPYTARAVCVFAFNRPELVIETNIRAVYIYFFFPGRAAVADDELLPVLEKTLYRANPRRWYNALMDYGAFLKKTEGNPARMSRSHVRQGRFEGSSRQLRGAIIKELLREACTKAALAKKTGADAQRLSCVLEQLCSEGLLVKRRKSYHLP